MHTACTVNDVFGLQRSLKMVCSDPPTLQGSLPSIGMEYFVVECYCTCIIEVLRYFFIQRSLTTSKMRKFQTLKLSQFHNEKTCWTENWWSSGIMSNFFGEFFYVLRSKKIFKKNYNFFLPPKTQKNSPQKLFIIPLDHQFLVLQVFSL